MSAYIAVEMTYTVGTGWSVSLAIAGHRSILGSIHLCLNLYGQSLHRSC